MHLSQLGTVEEMCFGTVLNNQSAYAIYRVLAAIWTAVCITDGKTGVFSVAVKATLKLVKFADHVKNKHLMICPQSDSFQLFWQRFKKDDAMLSRLCLCLEIFLILCCYTATLAHLNFKVCSSQGKFPEWLSQKNSGKVVFFIIHSIGSRETLFVSANLEWVPIYLLL